MIRHVAGSRGAFAALREDGELITWGHAAFGGSLAAEVFFCVIRVHQNKMVTKTKR